MQFSKKTYSIVEATTKLEHYCAYQERCHKEVVAKLQSMGIIPEAIQHIVVHLISHNFLNEERFAKSFTIGKFRIKKWGKQRIVRELKGREISKHNINSALNQIADIDYINTLDVLVQKKAEQLLTTEQHPLKRKKKIIDYLLYRGWEFHLVYEKVSEIECL